MAQIRRSSKARETASRTSRSRSRKSATPALAPKSEASGEAEPQLQPQPLLAPSTTPAITTTANPNAYPRIAVQPAPRLYHAMVDVELTAEPILAIISKMASDAITDIQHKAVASGTHNIRDFDWAGLAAHAITEAEKSAKQQLMEYITPAANDAWETVRQMEVDGGEGTPVVMPVSEVDDQGEDEIEDDVEPRDLGQPIEVPLLGDVVEAEEVADNEDEERALSTIAEEDEEDKTEMAFEGAVEDVPEDDVANDDTKGANDAETPDDKDAEMADDKDADADGDDDNWDGACFCGYGDVTGEPMVQCSKRKKCRHEWYHIPCLQKALRKGDLPTDDESKPWSCPYCGGYGVKAIMAPETVFGKNGKKGKK